jgi:hypothetical protein
MQIIAVLSVLLLFIAAVGQSWWWRYPVQPGQPALWYGSAAFCWGIFFLSVYMTWPTLKSMW